MYKAGENSDNQSDTQSVDSERVAFSGPIGERVAFSGPLSGPMSGPLNSGRKRARFSVPESTNMGGGSDEHYVEITLDLRDDSVAVQSVKLGGGAENEDPEQELRRLASFTKRPAPGRFDQTKSVAANALKGLKFISKADGGSGWTAIEKRFEELAVNGTLPRSAFGQCIGMKESKEFAGELFDALSRRRNITGNSITKSELEEFWEQISDRSSNSRLQTFFDMVDKDADGRITEEEVKDIISVSASANRLSNIQARAEEYAALIMEELDPDNIGYIEIHDLEMLLQTIRGTTTNRRKLRRMLKPTKESNPILRWYQDTKYFIQDNWKRVLLVALWLGIVSGLFAYKFVQYRNRAAFDVMGYCVSTAKGAAETLKFNMALILLPVCRNTITWLRNKTKLGAVVPFDDNLNFHEVIAVGIAIGVGLHAGSHLTCDFPRLLQATEEEYEPMKPFFGEQPENYWRFVKGTEGWTGIVMVVLMAIAFTLATPWLRRNKLNLPKIFKKLTGFNAFWYSHHLFVIVYALLIVHGYYLYLTKEWYKKTTWMYIAIPVLLYGCERLIRAFRSGIKPVKILKVAIYPGNVLALHMLKPQGFKYQSGQYMSVNCAAISPFEWHPFYITSAPRDAYLSVHIRILGDWTRQLRTVFSEKGGLLRADQLRASIFPRVLIDGPYGAPTQEYKKYEVVLLVGLGIWATPLISIVKDIVVNMKTQEEEEDELVNDTRSSKKSGGFKTRKTYFYWVTREQGSFDWFKDVMNEVAESDQNGAIELHNYCTNIYKEGDARSALIEMVQWLNHAKNGVDIVSGTRVKSHFAKPNWREVYKRIALNHPDQRVGVFYCGAPGLTKGLRRLALDFSYKTSTKFDFHHTTWICVMSGTALAHKNLGLSLILGFSVLSFRWL